jgi:hypothetical protein
MAVYSDFWKAAATVVRGAGRPPLAERDLLRGIFEFEHTGSVRALARQIDGIGVLDGAVADPDWQRRTDADALARFTAEREQVRADLAEIVAGTMNPTRMRQIEREAELILMVPRFTRGVRGHRYMSTAGLSAALCYALTVLWDPEKAFLPDARRCDWERCERFFFVSDANADKNPTNPGQRRTKYCSETCMRAAWKARKR